MATIIVMKGQRLGDFYPLKAGRNMVGRSPSHEVSLRDMTVSRNHMQIIGAADDLVFQAEDLGSTHGVFINGIRLKETMDLSEGDCISAGRVDLMFTLEEVESRDQALAVLEGQQSELATINFASSGVRGSGGGTVSAQGKIRRFRQWAGSSRTTLAIVFTDLVSSTEMNSHLGNETMDEKRRSHFGRVRTLVEKHDGYEIKSNGDGFMVAFHAAVKAVDFALGLCRDSGDPSLVVRVGAHIGPVIVEDEDVQGAAVSYAARLVEVGKDGGIWLSDEVKGHVDQEKAARHAPLEWRKKTGVTLKGFPEPQELWTVNESVGPS